MYTEEQIEQAEEIYDYIQYTLGAVLDNYTPKWFSTSDAYIDGGYMVFKTASLDGEGEEYKYPISVLSEKDPVAAFTKMLDVVKEAKEQAEATKREMLKANEESFEKKMLEKYIRKHGIPDNLLNEL